jgi:hypothetical protein
VSDDPMRQEYRPLDAIQKRQIEEVKAIGTHFHGLLRGLGKSRELALAQTKVEEAVMWATKHITGPGADEDSRR